VPADAGRAVPVLYSLGNAAFGTVSRFFPAQPPYGPVAVADVGPHRVARLDLRLIHVDNRVVRYRPRPADGPEAAAFLRSLYDPTIPGPAAARERRAAADSVRARRLDA
jgi:hypothetical protein